MVFLTKKSASTLLPILFVACLVYYLHPYYGIRHDSPLYLGQALLAMDPVTFKKDLFFAYGSQADYTLLPAVLGWLCLHWHPAQVFLWLTALSLGLFAASAYVLCRRLLNPEVGYWGLLALLIFPSVYGGTWILSYAEGFLTGRVLSEPIVLLMLAAYLGRSYGWSAVLFLVAALIHPLPALGGLMVLWAHLVVRRLIWLHLLWVPILIFAAALLGVPHLEFLSARFDPQWFDWIRGPNKLTFLSEWPAMDWTFILTDVFLLSLWARSASEPMRSMARAALLATAMGFALSYVFYEQLRFVFLGGLQFWRVDWLMHWLAIAGIPGLLSMEYKNSGPKSVQFLALLTIVALGTQNRISPDMAVIIYVLIPLYLSWPKVQRKIGPVLTRALIVSMFFAVALSLLKYSYNLLDRFSISGHLGNPPMMNFMILSHPVIGGLVVAFLVYLFKKRPGWRGCGLIFVLAALIFSFTHWDRRSAWTLEVEHTRGDGSEFGVTLEPSAQVFWSNELLAPWLVLRRPSYFSVQQTAGILFNRDTAREVIQRHTALDALNQNLDVCKIKKTSDRDDEVCNVQSITLTALCRVAKSSLDYIVLDFEADERYTGMWHLNAVDNAKKPITYYLYRCADLLKKAAADAPLNTSAIRAGS